MRKFFCRSILAEEVAPFPAECRSRRNRVKEKEE